MWATVNLAIGKKTVILEKPYDNNKSSLLSGLKIFFSFWVFLFCFVLFSLTDLW